MPGRFFQAGPPGLIIEPDMQQRWIEMGVVPLGGSPAEAEKYFVSEREKWGKVIKAAGIRGD